MRRLLIALLAVGLAGCGTGDDGPVSATAQPAATGTAVAARSEAPVSAGDPAVVDHENERSITIGGMGAEYAAPDRCIIDIGVTSRRPTVGESSRAAATSGQAMTEALLAAGIEASDIQTSEFSIHPYYDYYPTLTGFETNIAYRVTMPTIDAVGTVLASAIAAGGDDARAWGVRFEVDPTGLVEPARAEAWADAQARAQSLASLAGEPLGRVLDVHEKVLLSSTQGMMAGGEGDAAAFDIPVAPGVSGVVVLLTVTFEIGS